MKNIVQQLTEELTTQTANLQQVKHENTLLTGQLDALHKRLITAYEKLLSAARGLESEGDVASYDEIFAFLRESPEGQAVINAYLQGEIS